MLSCCIKGCKSRWKKSSVINFYRFPLSNEKIIKYWIAATGRNNWTPYSDARICSLHFINTDYYSDTEHNEKRIKPNVIPTQHVHPGILQVFQEDVGLKINEYNQNNTVILEELKSTNEQNNNIASTITECNQNNSPVPEERKLTNKQNNNTISTISECSNCVNYNKLLIENERLRKEIEDLKILQKKRLNQQANMFHTIIHNKETVLKEKMQMAQIKNRNLNRSVQRTGKSITNLRISLKDLKKKYNSQIKRNIKFKM